jgi:cytochrome P450
VQTHNVYSSFNAIDKQIRREKLKVVGKVINERGMRLFEPTMLEQIDVFLGLLLRSSRNFSEPGSDSHPISKSNPINVSQSINISDNITYLACDIIGLLAFGYGLELQTTSTNHFMVRGMSVANWFLNTRMQYFRLQQLRINDFVNRFETSVREQYRCLLEKMITGRLREDKHIRHDLYSVATEADHDVTKSGGNIRISEIWSEAAVFFPAGSSVESNFLSILLLLTLFNYPGAFSTSGALSALFFYLSRNPDCYNKLADEVRSEFSKGSEIVGGPQLSSCRYLRACIDETLRMSPPVPGTLWREMPSTDNGANPLIIDGYAIPKGTQVGVNIYTLHHSEEYFPDAFAFKPERWLETSEERQKVMRDAFTPFSIGYRGCAGKAMAYLESSLVIAKTMWYFDFKATPGKLSEVGAGTPGRTDGRGHAGEYQLYDTFNGAHDGPYLIFHPRGDLYHDLKIFH